jgi:hypothetical protein
MAFFLRVLAQGRCLAFSSTSTSRKEESPFRNDLASAITRATPVARERDPTGFLNEKPETRNQKRLKRYIVRLSIEIRVARFRADRRRRGGRTSARWGRGRSRRIAFLAGAEQLNIFGHNTEL